MDKEKLLESYDKVVDCNRCGFCTSYCPTYLSTGSELYSPRGRAQSLRGLIEGKISNSLEIEESIKSCILCGECTSICFSEVPIADLMVQARHFINQKKPLPRGLQFILHSVLTRPKLIRLLMKISSIGKKLKISTILRATGLLKRVSPALDAADRLVEELPFKSLSNYRSVRPHLEIRLEKERQEILVAQKKMTDFAKKGVPAPEAVKKLAASLPRQPKVAYFPACGSQYLRPKTGLSSLALLNFLNQEVLIPDLKCCGLPSQSYGDLDQSLYFADQNINKLQPRNFETILVDDTSCLSHILSYTDLFGADVEKRDQARKILSKVKNLTQFLLNKGLVDSLKQSFWKYGPVAYHDPCKSQYGLPKNDAARELLTAIPGLHLKTIPDADQCCGGGGTYNLVYPEISKDVLNAKIQNIMSTEAKYVITTSASCMMQVASGLKHAGSNIKVIHLTEALSHVLKLTT